MRCRLTLRPARARVFGRAIRTSNWQRVANENLRDSPMQIRCSACDKQIPVGSDGRLPPWCPSCGAEFKAGESLAGTESAPAARPGGNYSPVAKIEQRDSIPCFRARRIASFGMDMFRVYVTGRDLLFLY